MKPTFLALFFRAFVLRARFWIRIPTFWLSLIFGGFFVATALFFFGAIAAGPDADKNVFLQFLTSGASESDRLLALLFHAFLFLGIFSGSIFMLFRTQADFRAIAQTPEKLKLEGEILIMKGARLAREEAAELALSLGLPAAADSGAENTLPNATDSASRPIQTRRAKRL